MTYNDHAKGKALAQPGGEGVGLLLCSSHALFEAIKDTPGLAELQQQAQPGEGWFLQTGARRLPGYLEGGSGRKEPSQYWHASTSHASHMSVA